jgi:hypothetical protein
MFMEMIEPCRRKGQNNGREGESWDVPPRARQMTRHAMSSRAGSSGTWRKYLTVMAPYRRCFYHRRGAGDIQGEE